MIRVNVLLSFAAALWFGASPVFSQFADDGTGNTSSPGASAFGQQGTAVFAPTTDQIRNGGLGVRILFVGKNADGKTLTVSAELQNVTDQPIFLALIGPPPAAIDTQGVSYQLQNAAGLPQCKVLHNDVIKNCFLNETISSFKGFAYRDPLPGSAFSVLQPAASAIVATTFTAEQASTSGFLSISMNVALATGMRPADDRANDPQLENVAISFPLIALEGAQ
ncbi:hypothetical protein LCL97_11420 [Seohaeicola saemankumensis]|nr:hypothetical protein [Seohaeicola saemankumensis]MCA0871438.1 hypothetical protein [Seohaeicola saemankumensis]